MAGPQDDRTDVGAITIVVGAGNPEGLVDAPQGSIYTRLDGGPAGNSHMYVKTTPAGTLTGWNRVNTNPPGGS